MPKIFSFIAGPFEPVNDTQRCILEAMRQHPDIDTMQIRRHLMATDCILGIGTLYAELAALEDNEIIAAQEEAGEPERGFRPRWTWHLRKSID